MSSKTLNFTEIEEHASSLKAEERKDYLIKEYNIKNDEDPLLLSLLRSVEYRANKSFMGFNIEKEIEISEEERTETVKQLEAALSHESIYNTENGFNFDRCLQKLKEVQFSNLDEVKRVKQAISFVDEEIFWKCGDKNDKKIFITNELYNHFSLSKPNMKIVKEHCEDMFKVKRTEKKTAFQVQEADNSQFDIDEEFEGLYTLVPVGSTGSTIIKLHMSDIANHVIETKNVIMYKGNMFCNVDGCYKNDSVHIKAEVTRILNGIKKGCNSNKIKADLEDIMTNIKNTNPCSEYPFNKHNNAIPVQNGVVIIDFETGKLTLEDHNPKKWKFSYILPIEVDEKNNSNVIVEVLKEYTPDYKMLIQSIAQALLQTMGYGPYKKAYLLKGIKNCGKTTFLDIVERIIGDMCKSKVSLNEFTPSRRFAMAALEGKLMNIDDDLGYFKMSETGIFKKVTGGYSIQIEKKGIDSYDVHVTNVHMFTTNTPAGFDSRIYMDDAFWSRWCYIEFNHVFEKDDDFKNRILTEENITGFFNEVLKMVIEIKSNKDLLYVQEWDYVREKWTQEGNVLFKFLNENMVLGGRTPMIKEELLAAVTKWGFDNKVDSSLIPQSVVALGEQVVICGGSKDAQRSFEGAKDRVSHCFILNWVWKPASQYQSYIRTAKNDYNNLPINNSKSESEIIESIRNNKTLNTYQESKQVTA